MDIVSLPIEHDKEKLDSRFRLVVIAAQRAKELAYGAKAKVKTKSRKYPTVALEEALESQLEFLVGDEARVANEEAKKFDYKRFLEERRKEDLTELEKDLRVYLHEREETGKHVLEELFAEKQKEGEEEPEG